METHDAAARMVLAGSERAAPAGARDLGRAPADNTAEIAVLVRGKMSDTDMERRLTEEASKPVAERHYLSREELADMRGATAEDVEKVEAFAKRYGLQVARVDRAARTITLRGKISDIESAFGVELRTYEENGTVFRDHTGAVSLPSDVAPLVRGVLGLSTKPVARH